MPLFKLIPTKPIGTLDEIAPLDCVSDAQTRQRHVDSAVARNLPICIKRKRRQGKLAIVASGPSASDYVDMLKQWDGDVWGINGAFKWLMHRGIKPTAFIGGDPELLLKEYLHDTPDDATYYLASQAHPGVFDHLAGKNIRLWFMADNEVRFPFGAAQVYGGSSCLSRSPNLAWLLGWREVHIFGGDSSFTHKTHVHGGELPANCLPVELNGVVYRTIKPMLTQACEFVEQMVEWARPPEPLSVSLYGEGLMQAMFAHQCESGCYEQYLAEAHGKGLNRKQRRALGK